MLACVVVVAIHASPYAPTLAAQSIDADDSDIRHWHLEQCIAGLTYGAPLKLAVAYGGGLVRESTTGGADWCAPVVAKVGFGGAQGSLGLGASRGPLGTGFMVTANVLRTFSSALYATARRNYAGVSVHLWPALGLGGEIGIFTRLGDAAGESSAGKRVVSWSIGFGF